MPEMTPNERQLSTLLRIWTALFGIGAVLFLLAPDAVVALLDRIGPSIGLASIPPHPSTGPFWNVLAVSLMATVTYLAYQAQKDIAKGRRLVQAILIAKGVSALAFIAHFWIGPRSFPPLAGFLCDGSIFAVTFLAYKRVSGAS